MLRLIKYSKTLCLFILLAIALLFVQANADLALPDYMSKIVNNGIQQGGVENAVPVPSARARWTSSSLFMSADEQDARCWRLHPGGYKSRRITPSTVAEYPALANEPVYVLNAVDKAEIDRLNPVMGKALLVVSGIEQVAGRPGQGRGDGARCSASTCPSCRRDGSVCRAGQTARRRSCADDQRPVDAKFAALGDSMIIQMAVGAVKAEYAALGMDTGKLQTNYILHTGMLMLL